jgi:hypothetical protein
LLALPAKMYQCDRGPTQLDQNRAPGLQMPGRSVHTTDSVTRRCWWGLQPLNRRRWVFGGRRLEWGLWQ